jgi:clan AA aspartic protease (TIGR02281 family)
VRTLSAAVNGVEGVFILDTGATFVSVTRQFALRARLSPEAGDGLIMKTVGGIATADMAYASSLSVGKAEATSVVVAVLRGDDNPFGNKLDGLLGMSFLSRFNVTLLPTSLELKAIPIR